MPSRVPPPSWDPDTGTAVIHPLRDGHVCPPSGGRGPKLDHAATAGRKGPKNRLVRNCLFSFVPNQHHKPGGLQQQRFLLSRCGGSGSEIQVSTGPCALRSLQGTKLPGFFPSLVAPGVPWHAAAPACVCVCMNFPPYKDACPMGLGPTLMTSSEPDASAKTLYPSEVAVTAGGGGG